MKHTIPFSYSWILRHHLGENKKVLDVGCGEGYLMSQLNDDKKYEVTGIDLYKPYLKDAKKLGVYKKLIFGDVRKLKFKPSSFDTVMSSQVVEHLEKKEALKLIKVMEKIAGKKIVIGTTHGYFPFEPYGGHDDNPLQVHKCGWEIKELEKMGYKVYGQGISFIYKPGGLAYKMPYLGLLFFAFSYLMAPITYLFPQISAYLIAVKENA